MQSLIKHLEINPEDWETRLIYADWLEENNQMAESRSERNQATAIRAQEQALEKELASVCSQPQEAKMLAKALSWGIEVGTEAEWTYDEDYQSCDYQDENGEWLHADNCMICCVEITDEPDYRECLGGIGDPDQNYVRYTEAELTLELMGQWKKAHKG